MLKQVQHDVNLSLSTRKKQYVTLNLFQGLSSIKVLLYLKVQKSYVYILSNSTRNMLYIGVTSDLKKRILEHKNEIGSSFTQKYHLKFLIYFEEFSDINQAIAREKQLKNWRKDWKWNLVKSINPELKDLYDDL